MSARIECGGGGAAPAALPCLTRPTEVREQLRLLDLHPSRTLGQNFLIDRNILNILLAAADLGPADAVLEIGSGLGVVTTELLLRAERVLAIEKDERLAAFLRERTAAAGARIEVVCADVLDSDLSEVCRRGYRKVVANLPYGVASRALVNMALAEPGPACVVVTVQKEVAGRLAAEAGAKAYGLLTLLIRRVYRVEVIKSVSPTCFWPPPTVQSSVVRLVRRATPLVTDVAAEVFHAVTRHAFMHRRKQLASLLAECVANPARTKGAWQSALADLGWDPQARPEALSPEDWARLSLAIVATC